MAKAIVSDETIRVDGLKELRAALKEIGPKVPRELTKANKRVVSQTVVPKARAKAAALSLANAAGGTSRMGHIAVGTIKASASATAANIVAGGPKARWFQGMEFGSHGKRPRTRQFPAVKRPGYVLWPTIIAARQEIIEAYQVEIEALWDRAVPHVE